LPETRQADLVRAKVDVIVTGRPSGDIRGGGNRPPKTISDRVRVFLAGCGDRGFVESPGAGPGGKRDGYLVFKCSRTRSFNYSRKAVPTLVRVGYLYDPATTPDGSEPLAPKDGGHGD